MKNFPESDKSYFEKFRTTPVKIRPFNPRSKVIANALIAKLQKLFNKQKVEIIHRGSTAFGIAGKGDIELGVYPTTKDWDSVRILLEKEFGFAGHAEKDYLRFNTKVDDFEIEIIMMTGEVEKIDKALTNYLIARPHLLEEYEKLKYTYAFSKREYQREKDQFLRRVIEEIPE